MGMLLWIGVLVAAAAVIVVTVRKGDDDGKKKKIEGPPPRRELGPGTPHPMDLREGDIVSLAGEDWVVKATATYKSGGEKWRDYKVESGTQTRFLSVEEDDGDVELALMEKVKDLRFTDEPPRRLEYRGVSFELSEKGYAEYSEGKKLTGEEVQLFDYEATDGSDHLLSVEQWDDHEFEVSFGVEIEASDATYFPGS